jgi:hypothetical protein
VAPLSRIKVVRTSALRLRCCTLLSSTNATNGNTTVSPLISVTAVSFLQVHATWEDVNPQECSRLLHWRGKQTCFLFGFDPHAVRKYLQATPFIHGLRSFILLYICHSSLITLYFNSVVLLDFEPTQDDHYMEQIATYFSSALGH